MSSFLIVPVVVLVMVLVMVLVVLGVVFSLTEVYLKGLSFRNQREGYTETHTKREAVSTASRPGAATAVLKFIEDSH